MKAPFERAPVRHSAKDPGAMSHTLARLCGVTLLGRHGGKLGHENAITDPVQSFMPVTLFVDTTWSELWCVSGWAIHNPTKGVRSKVLQWHAYATSNWMDARKDLERRGSGGYLQLGFSPTDTIRSNALREVAEALANAVRVAAKAHI